MNKKLELLKRFINESVDELLTEKRKNPEANPRMTSAQQLEKYKDDPNVFITYSNNELATFNLKSTFDTPFGVYCYPLREMWKELETDTVPFAADRGYIHVLRNISPGFIDDIGNIQNSKGVSLIDKLLKFYAKIYFGETPEVQSAIRAITQLRDENAIKTPDLMVHELKRFFMPIIERSCRHKSIGGIVWWLSKRMSDQLADLETKKYGTKKPSFLWREILLEVGVTGIADKVGVGIIHENEPTQAVFFDPKSFKHIDTIVNDNRKHDVHKPRYDNGTLKHKPKSFIINKKGEREYLKPSGDKAERYLKHGKLDVDYSRLNPEQKKLYHNALTVKAMSGKVARGFPLEVLEKYFTDGELAEYIETLADSDYDETGKEKAFGGYAIPFVILKRITPSVMHKLSSRSINMLLSRHHYNPLSQASYEVLDDAHKKLYMSNPYIIHKDADSKFLDPTDDHNMI